MQRLEQGPYQTAAGLPLCADRQGLKALGLTWTFTVPRFEYCLLTQRSQSHRDGTLCLPLSHPGHRYSGDIKEQRFCFLTSFTNYISSDYFLPLLHFLNYPSIFLLLSFRPLPPTSSLFSSFFLVLIACSFSLLSPFFSTVVLPFFFSFPSFSFSSPFFLLRSSYPCLFPIPILYSPFPISLS